MADLTITQAAKLHIDSVCREYNCFAVMLSLKGGGCAGFEYEWGTISKENVKPEDEIIPSDEGNLVIEQSSLPFLENTEIDYVREMLGSKMVIRNPNVQSSCGCGVSISF